MIQGRVELLPLVAPGSEGQGAAPSSPGEPVRGVCDPPEREVVLAPLLLYGLVRGPLGAAAVLGDSWLRGILCERDLASYSQTI